MFYLIRSLLMSSYKGNNIKFSKMPTRKADGMTVKKMVNPALYPLSFTITKNCATHGTKSVKITDETIICLTLSKSFMS